MDIVTASKIIDKYNNQPHIRGSIDCNLLILELFDKSKFDRFVGRYKTLTGAIRVARKEFGVSSIYEMLSTESTYEPIDCNFQQPLDIVSFHGCHDVFISLGDKWFGVDDNDIFSVISKDNYNNKDYTIFRRK